MDGRKCSCGSKGACSPGKTGIPGHDQQICCGSKKWKLRSTFHPKGCTTCKMVGLNIESSLGVMNFLGVSEALLYTDRIAVPSPSTWCCICLGLFRGFQFRNILCEVLQINVSSSLCTFFYCFNTVASDLPAFRLKVKSLHFGKKLMVCKAKAKKRKTTGERTLNNIANRNILLLCTEFLSRSLVK